MARNTYDIANEAAGTAHHAAYFNALSGGATADEARQLAEQAARDARALLNAANKSEVLRPHADSVARSILSVLRRGRR